MKKKPKIELEATFAQLQSTIDALEDEHSPLQQSLDAFEHGINLARQAQQTLLEAEQKVKLLLEVEGEPRSADFDEPAAE